MKLCVDRKAAQSKQEEVGDCDQGSAELCRATCRAAHLEMNERGSDRDRDAVVLTAGDGALGRQLPPSNRTRSHQKTPSQLPGPDSLVDAAVPAAHRAAPPGAQPGLCPHQ